MSIEEARINLTESFVDYFFGDIYSLQPAIDEFESAVREDERKAAAARVEAIFHWPTEYDSADCDYYDAIHAAKGTLWK